jgi:broad specificity phosphatase PhoE
MPVIFLIRHGRAAASFGEALDPGLDEMGRTQAFKVANELRNMAPVQILSSPLKRCQETAAPLAKAWSTTPIISNGVTEIPSPTDIPKERSDWLQNLMPGDWSQTGAPVQAWRQNLIETLAGLSKDTVVFSHFIAINAAISHALGSDKVVCFRPDNASITKLEVEGPKFEVLDLGGEANTAVR